MWPANCSLDVSIHTAETELQNLSYPKSPQLGFLIFGNGTIIHLAVQAKTYVIMLNNLFSSYLASNQLIHLIGSASKVYSKYNYLSPFPSLLLHFHLCCSNPSSQSLHHLLPGPLHYLLIGLSYFPFVFC